MFISGKLGIGTTTPSEKLDVIGNIKASGNIYYNVTKEYPLSPGIFKVPGANPADSEVIGAFEVLAFDKTTVQHAYTTVHIPSDYANETDWQFEIYWSTPVNSVENVSWCVDYSMARSEDGTYLNATPTTICVLDTNQGAPYKLYETTKINISGTGTYRDDTFGFHLYRNCTSGLDNLNGDAYLVEATVYYIADREGKD